MPACGVERHDAPLVADAPLEPLCGQRTAASFLHCNMTNAIVRGCRKAFESRSPSQPPVAPSRPRRRRSAAGCSTMKMETALHSPRDGLVEGVFVEPRALVA
jgi:hypothetical protein